MYGEGDRKLKLTEDDIFVNKWDGIIPNNESMIKIYCNEEKYGIELKHQILNNQEFRKEMPVLLGERTGYKLKSEELEKENKQLKEKLEQLKMFFTQFSVENGELIRVDAKKLKALFDAKHSMENVKNG